VSGKYWKIRHILKMFVYEVLAKIMLKIEEKKRSIKVCEI